MSTCKGCDTELPPSRGQRERKWCSDRCRKRTLYGGSCVDCGAATDGSNGRAKAPERCNPCQAIHRTLWTRETIGAAIRQWHFEHGAFPAATDWNATLARRFGRPDRPVDFPSVETVQRVFGSWNAAIRAAGFEPRPVGRPLKAAA